MQWHMKQRGSRRDERGVTTVMIALLATTLIAAVGMSVDVGNAYSQRQRLQTATDNAALAIAQDCALYRSTCTTAGTNPAKATADLVVGQNISGASTTVTAPVSATSILGQGDLDQVDPVLLRIRDRRDAEDRDGDGDGDMGQGRSGGLSAPARWPLATASTRQMRFPRRTTS